ncbi:MAG: tetratricopeptide repeat protein, partial [Bacteroidota bacterium]
MLMLLILHIAGNAQKITSGKNIDSLTFALYQQNAWDSLIRAGTNAIQSGYDYYYMQMRVGIAWHQKTNYRKSVAYFRKALRLYPGDPVATGYLYYALLLGGRAEEAAHLAASQDSMMILRTRVSRPKFIEEVYLETGPGFPGYSDLNGKERTEHPADSIYNSSFYYNSVFYTHAGLRLNVRPWLNVYQGYSYLKSSFTQKLNFRGMVAPDFTETANQHEYYGNVRVHLPGGFLVTPAYHFISWKYDLRKDAYNPVFDVLTY